jgi:hypothetical protein
VLLTAAWTDLVYIECKESRIFNDECWTRWQHMCRLIKMDMFLYRFLLFYLINYEILNYIKIDFGGGLRGARHHVLRCQRPCHYVSFLLFYLINYEILNYIKIYLGGCGAPATMYFAAGGPATMFRFYYFI